MNEPYRLRYTNQVVGAVLLVILLFLIILMVALLQAGDYLVEPDVYWFEVSQEEIGDLRKGAEVIVLGESAGSIASISYVASSDRVRVDLNINPHLSQHIYDDSIVRLERKFGVGTPILIILRGKPDGGPLVPLLSGGQLAKFESDSDRVDAIAREIESVSQSVRLIQQKLDPTLTNISQAATSFQQTLTENADPAFIEARIASESLYTTSEAVRPETLNTLKTVRTATESLRDMIGTLVENDMRDTLTDISSTAKSVKRTSEVVNQDVAATLVTLREAAVQVQRLAVETRDLVRVIRKEADDLPGTTQHVNDTLSDTQDLVSEIRGHWLLRRSAIQRTRTPQLEPSSIRMGTPR